VFETFVPKKFCREFVTVRGHSLQLASLMAVVKGLKPCLDDWVPARRFGAYQKACRRYGLLCAPDTVFRVFSPRRINARIVGAEDLTTTHAYGRPWSAARQEGDVHVFVARSKKELCACRQEGWYPLVVKGRVVEKPLIDAYRFGPALGYPDCCCDFFRRRNNWSLYNFLYEVYKNSGPGPHPAACNPLTRDETYSYIAHMPCSFSCESTRDLAGRIRGAILEEEPAFVRAIERHAARPFLVFRERRIYAFEGALRGDRLDYRKAFFVGNQADEATHEKDIRRGDSLRVEKGVVVILKKGRLVKKIVWAAERRALGSPFLIAFA